jgi:uncharacterized protein (DUF885 family)
MKKLLVLIIILSTMIYACKIKNQASVSQSLADTAFYKLSDEFLSGYLAWRPGYALYLGLHEYDDKIVDFSAQSIKGELDRLNEFEKKLASTDTAQLSFKAYINYRVLLSTIRNEIFRFTDRQYYTRNPMVYATAINLGPYIIRDFAPLENRVNSIIAVERKAPDILAAARSNLDDSLPSPLIQFAINITKANVDFLTSGLPKAVREIKNDSLITEFETVNDKLVQELKLYAEYLEKEKLPKADNQFAIGREKYQKMLLYSEGIFMAPEKILELGMAALKKEQEVFNASAKIINPNKKPSEVLADMQKENSIAGNLFSVTQDRVQFIRQFILDHKIVSIPEKENLVVMETPPYYRDLGIAMADIVGPFEKTATGSFYYITPVDPKWTAKQKKEWLMMMDKYTMDFITIHEAYPGHYVQFLHLNASPVSNIQKVFNSYGFVEGWAHYSEKMMMDEGFGNSGDPVEAAKYRLAQSGEALVRLCRLCVSIKMHCQGMTVDEATKFFMDNCYQGEKPSNVEAMRGTYDPEYLLYSLGKMQILKLRGDYQKQEGANFSLQKFHDLLLDNGTPPIRLLREIILKDKKTWDDIL